MPQAALADKSELYTPREASFLRIVDTGRGSIKLNTITLAGSEPLMAETIDAAVMTIDNAARGEPIAQKLDAGFAILHRGEESIWLLMHWWLSTGIATEQLWRADLDTAETRFVPADPRLMACVWELGVIDFERRAWIATAMSGRPVADYLASRLPRSTV